jgi:hypothetical protein
VAKTQTFTDKSKKGGKSEFTFFKTVYAVQDEATGTWKFRERMVRVKDPKDIETMKF